MFTSSLEARTYFFACNFLWDVLSLFHYLNEDIAKERIDSPYLFKWGKPFENLAHWALEERWFPINSDKLAKSEEDMLLSAADTLGDLVTFRWGSELNVIAEGTHKRYPSMSESMWLYYYYCGFLRQTMVDFERVLQEPGSSMMYYEHYQKHIGLFRDMAAALEREHPFLDTQTDISADIVEAVLGDIDAQAQKLGAEWRQAVHSAAHDLKLPDFGEEA
jgi:hypothetical protein